MFDKYGKLLITIGSILVNSVAFAQHIVVIQPGLFFNMSSLLESSDTISFVATEHFDENEAQKAETIYKKGYICKLRSSQATLDGLGRIDDFENKIEEIELCLQEIVKNAGSIDFVLGNLENTVLPATILNKKLGIKSYNPEDILAMRNKADMKIRLAETNLVKFPKFARIDSSNLSTIHETARFIGYPLIIKPTLQAGSIGVRKINNSMELDEALFAIDPTAEYEIEQFIDEKIIHIDGVVRDGELQFLGAANYLNNCLTWLKEKCFFGSVLISDNNEIGKIKEFTRNVIRSFNFIDGVFHLEAFQSDNGDLTFLEIAPRFAGAQIPSIYQNLFGVNLPKEGVLALLGRESDIKTPKGYVDPTWKGEEISAYAIFPSPRTGVLKVNSITEPSNLKTVQSSSVPSVGSEISVPPTNIYFAVTAYHLKGQKSQVLDDLKKIETEFTIDVQ